MGTQIFYKGGFVKENHDSKSETPLISNIVSAMQNFKTCSEQVGSILNSSEFNAEHTSDHSNIKQRFFRLMSELENWHSKDPKLRGNRLSSYFTKSLVKYVPILKPGFEKFSYNDKSMRDVHKDIPDLLIELRTHHISQSGPACDIPISKDWNDRLLMRIVQFTALGDKEKSRLYDTWFESVKEE